MSEQIYLKIAQQFDVFSIFFAYFSEKYVSVKSVFNTWNGPLSDFKVEQLEKFKKSGGHMTLIKIVFVFNLRIQNLDLSESLLIDYPIFKHFRMFMLQYTEKKVINEYVLVISFFTVKN